MTATRRPLRADARRNRDAILQAAGELFAAEGSTVQMDDIAERSGLGIGTLYRHFATKQALVDAIVGRRVQAMTDLATRVAEEEDPADAFEVLLRGYLEAAEGDVAYRWAVLGPESPNWDQLGSEKESWGDAIRPILEAAVAAGRLRADFTAMDFVLVTRGIMVNMTPRGDWHRHLDLALAGLAPGA